MWTNNKTVSWLACLSDEERKEMLDAARQSFDAMKRTLKERELRIKKQKLDKLKEKQDKKDKKDTKKINQKIKLTQTNRGRWTLDRRRN